MAIGGLIGLQSTLSSTVEAETETVPMFIRDTVTNTIVDKRIVIETDTLVRNVFVPIPVRDEIWAARAMRLIPLPTTDCPITPVKEQVAETVNSVPIG